jgi:hypothetical protein
MSSAINRIERAIARGLSDLDPQVRAVSDSSKNSSPVRALVDIVVAGHTHQLHAVWAGEGWPADVRAALEHLESVAPAVVVARDFSPGAIDALRETGANYVDEAGRVRIRSSSGLLVQKELASKPKPRRPQFKWAKSTLACAEAILARPELVHRASQLAAVTGWSVPQASNVLRKFDAQGWTQKEGPERGRSAARELADVDALLKSWVVGVREERRNLRSTHRVLRDPMAFLHHELAEALAGIGWAVTGWAGLELAAPYATAVPTLQCYVESSAFGPKLDRAISQAGLRDVDEGARVEFIEATGVVLSLASGQPVAVVSAPRLYADLLAIGGRAATAAEHVRETLLVF